jgi:C-terminal processing protease CtpA/Prc
MESRPIGYEVNRQGQRNPILAEGTPIVRDSPIIALIDRESASGAEILAAALRDYNISPLVGTNTAGNVGVASVIRLLDGSAIQVTEQRFVTALDVQLDRVGVTPDVTLERTDADIEAGRDPQLDRALQLMAAQVGVR